MSFSETYDLSARKHTTSNFVHSDNPINFRQRIHFSQWSLLKLFYR
jgi:hypothetical protein